MINSTGRRKNLTLNNVRKQVNPYLREIFPEVGAREKIAARVGVSDRTIGKDQGDQVSASLQDPRFSGKAWEKVGEGKMKVDKGYN